MQSCGVICLAHLVERDIPASGRAEIRDFPCRPPQRILQITQMTVAYDYILFSTTCQRLGRSYERQLTRCIDWCERHRISSSDERSFDQGRSAYTGAHVGDEGQLRRFIDLVEAGRIERGRYLIVESLDRLGRRDVWWAFPLFTNLISKGLLK